MGRKILKIASLVLFVMAAVFTLAFTSHEAGEATCEKIEVIYDGHQSVSLAKEEILKLVNASDDSLLHKNLRNINTEKIELEVEKNKTIKNAEVFKNVIGSGTGFAGVLSVKVTFRKPVLRIMSGNDEYFLDRDKVQIPVSTKYTANVLVATGKIEPEFASNELLDFVEFLENDEFLKAQIKQIDVRAKHELVLTPLVGDHLIEMGTLENYPDKMNRLKVFYKKVMAQNNWDKYKKISVKYNNQVIGTKR